MDFRSLEEAKKRVGGAFRLSVLLQKRIIELIRSGSSDRDKNPIDVALREILDGKIKLEMIPTEEFEKMVEEARLEREGRMAASAETDDGFSPPTAMPTIDLAADPLNPGTP